MLLSLFKKEILLSDSVSFIRSEHDYAGFSFSAFEVRSDKNRRCRNDLKCLSFVVEPVCLTCYYLQGAEGLGVVMSLML